MSHLRIIAIYPLLNQLELITTDGRRFYFKPQTSVRGLKIGQLFNLNKGSL